MNWTSVFSSVYPSCVWRMPQHGNAVYFTFDDGPTPEVTEAVLDLLDAHEAKATFFVIGKNVVQHPELYQKILARRHSVGNHTYHHERGWQTSLNDYLSSIEQTTKQVSSALFRPPYGRITPAQVRALKPYYRIVMWDILSYDFDPKQTPEKCAQRVIQKLRPGAIVVFHDSSKAKKNMLPALEACLAYCKKMKLIPVALPMSYHAY